MSMKMKYLFGTCLLLAGFASCTSDELVPAGGGIDGNVPGQGAVVFSITGLGSGSVENPDTRATVLATEEENRIDSLDIYVFAYDSDGNLTDNIATPDLAGITALTPQADADVTDNTKWYLQEKWTWKNPEPGHSSGVVDTSKPQLHEIATLGGSGVARTATIYPQKGRCLKFFIVANGGELTAAGSDAVWTPVFTDAAATPAVAGTKASDFLNLRLRLGARPVDAAQVLPIGCPLPMTAQMAATTADMVNMVGPNAPAQSTRPAVLTRAVTRFDVVNYAALPSQGDYTLTDVYVSNHYAFTNMQNLVPAASPVKATVKHSLDGRTWTSYANPATNERAMLLPSTFYTSPTLAGTAAMKLGLRGVLGKSTAQPGELLTPLNKDVDVVDANGTPIVLKANYRYVLNIKKLGSDVNVVFSIIDWDSKILDADFSNAPMPKLICENSQGITWNVADTDMNQHSVTMANTAVGGRLAFELGTYTEDELADILSDPTNALKIPFEVSVVSLNDDPALPEDNIWLANPIITFDPIKRDRFNVVLDIRPEAEVALNVRPDLMVKVVNKEHREKQLFFRVHSAWKAPERPDNGAPAPIVDGNAVYEVNGYWVTAPDANSSKAYEWNSDTSATTMQSDPCANHGNWRMPTMKDFEVMAGWTDTWPWVDTTDSYDYHDVSNKDAWSAAFGIGSYWSSVASSAIANCVWYIHFNAGEMSYSAFPSTCIFSIRCVQKK